MNSEHRRITIIRLQSLLTEVKKFKKDSDKWFFLGYISSIVDELIFYSQVTKVTESSSS